MKNFYKPLNKLEMNQLNKLNNPLFELMFILGWRRSEIAQLILKTKCLRTHYFIKFKQRKEPEYKDLTIEERTLLKQSIDRYETFKAWILRYKNGENLNKCIRGLSRLINLIFERASSELGFKLTPHRLRASHASVLARLGASPFQIQASLNHENLETTERYVQLTDQDVVTNRQLLYEFETFEGMNFAELKKRVLEQKKLIRRLEEKLFESETRQEAEKSEK